MKKYKLKKTKNQIFEEYSMPLVPEKTFERIEHCGEYLCFLYDESLKNKKLHKGNFCKNRFCTICAWRKAVKDSFKLTIMMEYIRQKSNKEFIFLTLTTPNVTGDKLEQEIKKYNKAFGNLLKRKELEGVVKGYVRKLEVTYDKQEFITKELYQKKKDYYKNRNLRVGDLNPTYDTYNPHFHVLIAVNKSYFTDKDYYINQKKWLALWQDVTGDSSITQVNVKKTTQGDLKEVYEVAKYSAKDTDYLVSKGVFETFYKALSGKQLIVYGGLFAEALRLFKSGQLNEYKKKDLVEYYYMIVYKWHLKDYEEYKKRELTEDEKKKFRSYFIDEGDVD